MTPRGGAGRGQGRKPSPDSSERKDHHIRVRNDVWAWLSTDGDASAKIEELAQKAMALEKQAGGGNPGG
jgi:hypothetical protein